MAVIDRPKCTYWNKRRPCTLKHWALFVGKGANERLYAMSDLGCAVHDRQGLNKAILEALDKGYEVSSKHNAQVSLALRENINRKMNYIRELENAIRELP